MYSIYCTGNNDLVFHKLENSFFHNSWLAWFMISCGVVNVDHHAANLVACSSNQISTPPWWYFSLLKIYKFACQATLQTPQKIWHILHITMHSLVSQSATHSITIEQKIQVTTVGNIRFVKIGPRLSKLLLLIIC